MTRVVLFFSSMQFSYPNAFSALAACAGLAVSPSTSAAAKMPLIVVSGFMAGNGSRVPACGQAELVGARANNELSNSAIFLKD